MADTKTNEPTYREKMQELAAPYGVPGKDHANLLLYLQTVEANFGGCPREDNCGRHMRSRHHPDSAAGFGDLTWEPEKHGSLNWDGTRVDQDDWDAIGDLESAGLLQDMGTGLHPCVKLTDKGHELCVKLIRLRGETQRKPCLPS